MKTKQIKDLFKVSAKGHIRDITINGVSLLEYFKDDYIKVCEFLDFNKLIKFNLETHRDNPLELLYQKLQTSDSDNKVVSERFNYYNPPHRLKACLRIIGLYEDKIEKLDDTLHSIKNHLFKFLLEIPIEEEEEIHINTEQGTISFKLFVYNVVVN